MNLRKNIPIVIAGAVALILLVAAIAALIHFKAEYGRVDRDLQNGLQRLNALNQQSPYPSEENVTLAENRLGLLQGYFNGLMTGLRSGQIEPMLIEPAEFPPLLERTVRELRATASQSDVKLPEDFAFGFDRYLKGQLPKAEDIPRLVVELKAVEQLGRMLFDARIEEVVGVTREVFESVDQPTTTEQVGRGGGRRTVVQTQPARAQAAVPEQEEHELYSIEHFTLEFTARESAVWEVLNRLAASDLFVVVNSVQLMGKKLELQPLEQTKTSTAGGMSPASRGAPQFKSSMQAFEERVVAGREPVRVIIELSMYRFKAFS